MQSRAIVIAVAGALFAPAVYADTVNVNVYGELRLGLENINGATTNAANNVPATTIRAVDNTSIFGVKGSEDLGDDWLAKFQLEGALHADNGTTNPAALNTRNTFVALGQAHIGTLLVGQYDSPYKVARGYLTATPVDNSTAEVSTFWGHAKGTGTFYTRQADTVQYLSPTWAGFNFRVGYAPDTAKSTTANKQRWSLAGIYDGSRLFGSVAYENRADNAAPILTGSYRATAATAGVKIGHGDVAVGWEHFSGADSISANKAATIAQTNVYLATNWQFAEHWNVGGHFARAGSSNTGNDDSAHVLSVGVRYDLSKRTNVTSYYSHISNGSKATFYFNVNAEAGTGVQPGESPNVIGFGINHKF